MALKPLAFDTIHYAVECLMFNRAHALEVINQEDNGLSIEQRQAIAEKISELKAPPKTVRDKNKLENRLIEVLQPSTMKALRDPKIVAEVLYFVLYKDNGAYWARKTFEILAPKADIKKCLATRVLVDRKILSDMDVSTLLEDLHGRHFLGPYEWSTRKIQGLLELAPQFAQLNITEDWIPVEFIDRIGMAIAACKKTQFRRIFEKEKPYHQRRTYYQTFPVFREFGASYSMRPYRVEDVFDNFPHRLEKFETQIYGENLGELNVFENRQLTSLKLKILISDGQVISREHIETLKKLPLEGLNIRGSETSVEEFLMFAELPSLKELDLCYCTRITFAGFAALLRASSSIKTLALEPYHQITDENGRLYSLTYEEILELQAQFPHIAFVNREGMRWQ